MELSEGVKCYEIIRSPISKKKNYLQKVLYIASKNFDKNFNSYFLFDIMFRLSVQLYGRLWICGRTITDLVALVQT